MDTSEQYIKMCERAWKIQEQRPQVMVGLIPHCYKGRYVYDVDSDSNFWYYSNHLIWLPRQDQLQEMVDISLGNLAHEFGHFAIKYQVWGNGYPQIYRTMEQLWLAFVMKEKYSKVWSGEDWVD